MVYMKGKKIGQAMMMCTCKKYVKWWGKLEYVNMCRKGRKYCGGIKWMKENGNRKIEVIEVKWVLEYI